MVGGFFIDLVVIACAIWVFNDAANRKVGVYTVEEGVNKGYKRGFSPIVWGIGCLFILPFFIYLFRRKSLISQAQGNPVETDKSFSWVILFLVIAAIEMYSYKDILFN